MFAQINKTAWLLCMLLCSSLKAAPTFLEPSSPAPHSKPEQVCTLPPPSSFFVIQTGPTWASLGWTTVPGAAAYHIITKEVATGLIVDDRTVPSFTSTTTINNLAPNTPYQSWIWTVCQNGEDGNGSNTTTPTTIILDLVVEGYPAPSGCLEEDCELAIPPPPLPPVGCDFPWAPNAQTYFKVISNSGGMERYFMVNTVDNKVNLYPDNTVNSPYEFEEITDNQNNCVAVRIKFSQSNIARVSAVRHALAGTGQLFREGGLGENSQYFKIFRLGACPEGRSGNPITWSDQGIPIGTLPFILAAPNPFTDQLEVQINFPAKGEQVALHLSDMQGRVVAARQVPGGQQKYSLPTADLPPGIYFLRAESAGETQTIKVVKTR